MKKVILALAIVSVSFAACNDSDKTTETTTNSDTTTVITPVSADTMTVITDTTVKTTIKTDTINKK